MICTTGGCERPAHARGYDNAADKVTKGRWRLVGGAR